MAKIDTVTFTGASGNTYEFIAYSIDTSFNNIGAVYVFTNQFEGVQGRYQYRPLYIGKTSELADRISGHEKWDCVNEHGVNSICVYVEGNATSRSKIESDLIANYSTPCNETAQ